MSTEQSQSVTISALRDAAELWQSAADRMSNKLLRPVSCGDALSMFLRKDSDAELLKLFLTIVDDDESDRADVDSDEIIATTTTPASATKEFPSEPRNLMDTLHPRDQQVMRCLDASLHRKKSKRIRIGDIVCGDLSYTEIRAILEDLALRSKGKLVKVSGEFVEFTGQGQITILYDAEDRRLNRDIDTSTHEAWTRDLRTGDGPNDP